VSDFWFADNQNKWLWGTNAAIPPEYTRCWEIEFECPEPGHPWFTIHVDPATGEIVGYAWC
jgi:hypothetical protein